MLRAARCGITALSVSVLATVLTGCASDEGANGGARRLAQGQTCPKIRAELDKLDRRGVGQRAQAASSGQRLKPAQQAEVDTYNRLLSDYLSGQCHV